MTLQPHPSYPSARGYVLKLHRDADPATGRLSGRLEHIASGEAAEFSSGAQLLRLLQAHATRTAGAAGKETL